MALQIIHSVHLSWKCSVDNEIFGVIINTLIIFQIAVETEPSRAVFFLIFEDCIDESILGIVKGHKILVVFRTCALSDESIEPLVGLLEIRSHQVLGLQQRLMEKAEIVHQVQRCVLVFIWLIGWDHCLLWFLHQRPYVFQMSLRII